MNAEQTKSKTFDEAGCWEGFYGAEGWGDVSDDDPAAQPLYREFEGNCLAVADKNGIEIYFASDDDWREQEIYRLDRPFPTQAEARAFLDSLPTDVTVEAAVGDFGFEEV